MHAPYRQFLEVEVFSSRDGAKGCEDKGAGGDVAGTLGPTVECAHDSMRAPTYHAR